MPTNEMKLYIMLVLEYNLYKMRNITSKRGLLLKNLDIFCLEFLPPPLHMLRLPNPSLQHKFLDFLSLSCFKMDYTFILLEYLLTLDNSNKTPLKCRYLVNENQIILWLCFE